VHGVSSTQERVVGEDTNNGASENFNNGGHQQRRKCPALSLANYAATCAKTSFLLAPFLW